MATNFRSRVATDRHRYHVRYNTSDGIVVFLRGNPLSPEETAECCDIPLVIVGKEVRQETDPDPPHMTHSIKYLKLAPVGPSLGNDKVRLSLLNGISLEEPIALYWCAPFEQHFNELWSMYSDRSSHMYNEEVRAALLHGLKQQQAFYPKLTCAELFKQLRVKPETSKTALALGYPQEPVEEEPVPPELLDLPAAPESPPPA